MAFTINAAATWIKHTTKDAKAWLVFKDWKNEAHEYLPMRFCLVVVAALVASALAQQFRSCDPTTCCCPGDPTGEACCGPGQACAGTGLGSCGCTSAGPAPCVADSGARLGDRRKCGLGVVTDLASVCGRTNPVCDCAVHSPCGAPPGTGSCLSSGQQDTLAEVM